jgi:hypothetical protein
MLKIFAKIKVVAGVHSVGVTLQQWNAQFLLHSSLLALVV